MHTFAVKTPSLVIFYCFLISFYFAVDAGVQAVAPFHTNLKAAF